MNPVWSVLDAPRLGLGELRIMLLKLLYHFICVVIMNNGDLYMIHDLRVLVKHLMIIKLLTFMS